MHCFQVLAVVGLELVSAFVYAFPSVQVSILGNISRDSTAQTTFRDLVVFGDSYSDSGASLHFSSVYFPVNMV
jgi:hypothetical protein